MHADDFCVFYFWCFRLFFGGGGPGGYNDWCIKSRQCVEEAGLCVEGPGRNWRLKLKNKMDNNFPFITLSQVEIVLFFVCLWFCFFLVLFCLCIIWHIYSA